MTEPAPNGRPSTLTISPIEVPEEPESCAQAEATGVRALLCAIIGRAVLDLRHGSRLDRATAYRFLFHRSSCFEAWCHQLDLSASAIRARLAHEDPLDLEDGLLAHRRRVSEAATRGWDKRRQRLGVP